jgi:hypothetical protein
MQIPIEDLINAEDDVTSVKLKITMLGLIIAKLPLTTALKQKKNYLKR